MNEKKVDLEIRKSRRKRVSVEEERNCKLEGRREGRIGRGKRRESVSRYRDTDQLC